MRAECMAGEHMLGLEFNGSFNRYTGNRANFTAQNTWLFKTMVTGEFRLPLKLSLTTDFSVYNRRGFTDNVLNTDNFVWNARLTYPAFDDKLLIMLDGYDILHNLKNVSYSINAQARTETLRTVLPRYLMLHVQWKFDIKPKSPRKKQ